MSGGVGDVEVDTLEDTAGIVPRTSESKHLLCEAGENTRIYCERS
jgi:hypothetical protein